MDMDLKVSTHHLPEKEKPYDDGFPLDSLCKLNLKETSDVVKLFPNTMAYKDKTRSNVVEAPSTPGRPVFSFSVGSRKSVPSKWDNAQKWLISSPDSPAHHAFVKSPDYVSNQSAGNNGFMVKQPAAHQQQQQRQQQQQEHVDTKTEVSVFQVPTSVVSMCMEHDHHNSHNGVSPSESSDVLLKDKYTHGDEANYSRFRCVVPIKEGFLFTSMKDASTEVVHEIKHADTMGTNMTPHRNSAASRCPTPFKIMSPPRHNTPCMSGPLALMNASSSFDIAELQECHLAKLQLETPFDSVTCNWSSREEEEEDVSKSLRHFEMNNECTKNVPEPIKHCAWEEEQKNKSHLRYQREEANIQAWVDLQNAKAEAESRKLEVKIQKMRSKFEEKMMKRMAIVHRKAEELRSVAQYEHNVQLPKESNRSNKTKELHESMHFSGPIGSCGCFNSL